MPEPAIEHDGPADAAMPPEPADDTVAPDVTVTPEPRENADLLIWMTWPLVSWTMPVLMYVLMLKSGGWEMLLLLPFMILIVPGLALLGLLPRFILRRAGAKTSLSIVSIAMIVNWWSQILLALSHRGLGDSGGIDSILGDAFGIRDGTQASLSGIAIIVAVLSYLAAVVSASMLADAPGRRRMPSWVVVVVMLVVPLLFLGVVKGVAMAGEAQEEAAAAAEAREWDDAQRSLVPLRQDIAENGWTIDCCGMDDDDPRSYENGQKRLASMSVYMSVQMEGVPADLFDEMVDVAAAHDWEVTDTEIPASEPTTDATPAPAPDPTAVPAPLARGQAWTGTLTATDDEERLLTIRVGSVAGAADPSSIVSVELRTVPRPAADVVEVLWWERLTEEDERQPPVDGITFRYDEWPSLLRLAV